jgi:hypothetical protein
VRIQRAGTAIMDGAWVTTGGFPGQNAQNAPPRVTRRQSPK